MAGFRILRVDAACCLAVVFAVLSTSGLSLGQYEGESEPSEQPVEIRSAGDSGETTEGWSWEGEEDASESARPFRWYGEDPSYTGNSIKPARGSVQRGTRFGFGVAGFILLGFVLMLCSLTGVGFCILIGMLASKKGRSPVLWGILAIVPIANIAVWWLVGLPDAGLVSRVERIERQLSGGEHVNT